MTPMRHKLNDRVYEIGAIRLFMQGGWMRVIVTRDGGRYVEVYNDIFFSVQHSHDVT